ncbi:MAG TPA: alpha-mannosidase [Lentisphaeria bacterium]|nr:MAG: alpha-mannosidase [Lentisphaerae bacterium GWF2_50_93]HCE46022.1 alpha-mannosidase [Lentisphaeria bacterium]
MSMNPEWRRRVDNWRWKMPSLFYLQLGTIDFEGFVTKEQLTAKEALKKQFKKMQPGAEWGAKWEYGWFKGRMSIPKSAAGERIAARINVGGEAAISVNGMNYGANDIGHKEITLSRKAKGGEKFEMLVESYAGHGTRTSGGGPLPYGQQTVPEPGPTQVKVGVNSFGIWEEELYQLWFDVETLVLLRDAMLDTESLRVAQIDDALKEMTLVVDVELPRKEMLATVRAGRKILKPMLDLKNGPTSPLMKCFGHSHIDVAWLWPLQETERKCCRTFSSQLALMEEYPEYKFLQSQAHLYRMVKRKYPELYERVKKSVRKGQWIPDGGMWVEPDTNVTGGESLIRQFMHGKRFFKDEFGVESELMWLPDVFGYSGALPQIMEGCGIKYFSTQKIFWTYNGGDPFPYNIFWWEGIDGTRVLSYLHNDYNSETKPTHVMNRWNERVQKDAIHSGRMMPFGYGDGGGGPTREHLEFLRREKNLEGLPRCQIDVPVSYFEDIRTDKLPTWVGELYFQAHRGTYTSQAKTKKGNRMSENFLREAELWSAVAGVLAGFKYPLQEVDSLWKDILLNQFHDIIPGSSIQRVYEEAEASYANVISQTREIAGKACRKLLDSRKDQVTVFNSLSWDRDAVVELPSAFTGAETIDGKKLSVQKHDGKNFALVEDIPSAGWMPVRKSAPAKAESSLKASAKCLENEFLKISIDASGEITEILDKESGRDFAAGACNSIRMYKDVPSSYDAWDIDSIYKLQPVALDRKAKIEVIAGGPVFASVRVERMLNISKLVQEIIIYAGSRRIDFKTVVDWKESHKMLKANFPVSVKAEDALHEIQFGHTRRPTHLTRPYDATRFEVCNHKWAALVEEERGAAVLNDCKYGVSVEENSINLTLLKSPLAPDMNADKGIQEFTYSFYCWNKTFKHSGLIRSAYELNIPAFAVEGGAEKKSLFSIDEENVIIETVKPAEDGSGDVIVRLYEAARTATSCELRTSLPFKKLVETDMLENVKREVKTSSGACRLDFRPFQIRTLRFVS